MNKYNLFFCLTLLLTVVLYIPTANAVDDYQESYSDNVADPLEGLNRQVFKFNMTVDKLFLRPVAKGYRQIVPSPARKGVRNALRNLKEPVNFVNSALQGDVENTFSSFWRFSLNTVFGIGGIFDFTGEYTDLNYRQEDFGQTLGRYNIGHGVYLVVPLFGPSSSRDLVGTVADVFTDPITYADDSVIVLRTSVEAVDKRERFLDIIDEIERTSFDPYASIRSLYVQSRNNSVKNGKVKVEY